MNKSSRRILSTGLLTSNFNDSLIKLEHGRIITFHSFTWMTLCISAVDLMQVELIFASKRGSNYFTRRLWQVRTLWHGTLYWWSFVKGIHRSPLDSLHKWPVLWRFDVSFAVSSNKYLNKQSIRWRFQTALAFKWRHSNANLNICFLYPDNSS